MVLSLKTRRPLAEVLSEQMVEPERLEAQVPAWRTRLFLVERDYTLFSLGEEEVGALIPRLPAKIATEAALTGHLVLATPRATVQEALQRTIE